MMPYPHNISYLNRAMIMISIILILPFLLSSHALGESEFYSEFLDEETPVVLQEMPARQPSSIDRVWVAPDYSNQEASLGWASDAFKVPAGLEERVKFWIDIYSKFSTDQGLLHDSEHTSLIYEVVDFTDIMKNESLNKYQKVKERERRVKSLKQSIADRLNRLNKISSAEGLEGDDLRYWNLFQNIEEKNKFSAAAVKGRLRFQLGQRDRFIEGIYFSGSYIREMEAIFRSEKLPIELTRIPFVESSFNLRARSRVGASGIWQFMRRTGRSYMTISRAIDERNDPIISTKASARLLRHYFEMLNSWPLAVTGYNHGAYGVRRLVQKMGTSDIAKLVNEGEKARFGFASQNFYASFLAALTVEREANQYLQENLPYGPKISASIIKAPRTLPYKMLLSWFDGDSEKAQFYNPTLTSLVVKGRILIPQGTPVSVPESKETTVSEFFKTPNSRPTAKPKDLEIGTRQTYRVRSGDTLSGIARDFGISILLIQEANELEHPRNLRAGQTLFIPSPN